MKLLFVIPEWTLYVWFDRGEDALGVIEALERADGLCFVKQLLNRGSILLDQSEDLCLSVAE